MSLQILQWLCYGPARISEQVLAFEISKNYLEKLYGKLIFLPLKWHQMQHSGATVNRIRKGHTALKSFFSNGFVYVHTLAQLVLSVSAMVVFLPVFGTIAVGIGLLTMWLIARFDRTFIKLLNDVNEKDHAVNAKLTDGLSKIVSVLTLRLEHAFRSELMAKVQAMFVPFRRTVVVNEWKWFSAGTMVSLIYAVMVGGYVFQHYSPGEFFSLGGLVMILGFVNQFTNVFYTVAAQYTQIVHYYTDVQGASYIEQSDSTPIPAPPINSFLNISWQEIEVRNLNFSYEVPTAQGLSRPTGVKDVRLKLQRSHKIALIGESGSGKSTLLALLRGTQQPDQFEIVVDGGRVNNWRELNQKVTLLPQQSELFENTILHNITLGFPYEEKDIAEACRVARVTDFTCNFPEGLNTMLGENAGNLSGGQRQRIALARGILAARNSDIVLLDEPTSSLDEELEIQIYNELIDLFDTKVLIASFHNKKLAVLFDEVIFMKNGAILTNSPNQCLD